MSDKLKVLIADDEADLAELLAELLEDDFDCRPESKVDRIKAAAESGDYDAIITDQNMPGYSAIDLLSTLKEHKHKIPVIVLTGADGSDPSNQKALELGAFKIITKPVGDPDILVSAINDAKKALG